MAGTLRFGRHKRKSRETVIPQPTPVSPEFEIPWRPVTWRNNIRGSMLTELKKFHLRTSDISCLKIMLHGPVGAGKSSFINSVSTTLQGRNSVVALADSTAGASFTTKFNPVCPITKHNSHFKEDPSINDKVHCLVSVLPADKISFITEDVMQKMKHVHKMARDLGIPEFIIMSMVDKACPLVSKDLRKIYTSKKIKDKIMECSRRSEVPVEYIYPVKNYSEEVTIDLDKDILILKESLDRRCSASCTCSSNHTQHFSPYTFSETNKKQLLSKLNNFQLCLSEVNVMKILLHGPVGAGKSSFVNSVYTALQGHISSIALASAAADKSFTQQFKFHKLKKGGPGSFYPFGFTDIMGLEPGSLEGVQTDDIISILEGHVRNGYTFNPVRPLAKGSPEYNSDPSLNDQVHCLVSVLPADKISLISDEVIKKMRAVRERARDLDIPQVVVIPMVDIACPLVSQDIRKVYTSKKIKEKMQECSNRLGVPMNCIFPVKNYSEEVNNNVCLDVLILMAITNIVTFANDYIEEKLFTDND
ncbi:interferon-induced protein 44-like [Hoplias malabaricus]|uniref:interferon-induced protein 44-like n=1 Tax=Hoplias malabaricus TaxID=27720 RepID=UPI0034617F83